MVHTYDPKQGQLIVGGAIINGFADGEFILVERTSDMFTMTSGTDGIVSRAKSNDKSGTITITLAQTSSGNDILSGIARRDELANQGVVSVVFKDLSGRSSAFAASAWVRKPASMGNAKEISNREWVLDCANLEIFVGGNAISVPA